jgi:RNA polymerase sigma-70 factor (ECF subfamily)
MTANIDSDKFLQVLENHKRILYKVANSYCSNADHRQDLIQEIILQLWKSFPEYNDQFKLSTWIYRIALNVAISQFRKEKSWKGFVKKAGNGYLLVEDTTEINEPAEEVLYLQKFISELKAIDKALMLLYLEDRTHNEIAEILGLSTTNVATKINRIKNKLKKRFKKLKITHNE